MRKRGRGGEREDGKERERIRKRANEKRMKK